MNSQATRTRTGATGHVPVPRSDLIVGGLAAIGGLAVIIYGRTMPTMGEGDPGPGLFPTMIGSLAVLFGVLLILLAFIKQRRSASVAEPATDAQNSAHPDDAPTSSNETGTSDEASVGVADEIATSPTRRLVNGLVVLGAIVFYVVAVEPLGFVITMFVLLIVLMLTLRGKMLTAVLVSAGMTALLYAMFELILLVQLPNGLLGV